MTMTHSDWTLELAQIAANNQDPLRSELAAVTARLAQCEDEMSSLRTRKTVISYILAMGDEPNRQESGGQLTLHEAIKAVLQDGHYLMRAPEIAAEVNRRRLYRGRSGQNVEVQQIHARVAQYPDLFLKSGPSIGLRTNEARIEQWERARRDLKDG